MINLFQVFFSIDRLDIDPLKGFPCQVIYRAATKFAFSDAPPRVFFACHVVVLHQMGQTAGYFPFRSGPCLLSVFPALKHLK